MFDGVNSLQHSLSHATSCSCFRSRAPVPSCRLTQSSVKLSSIFPVRSRRDRKDVCQHAAQRPESSADANSAGSNDRRANDATESKESMDESSEDVLERLRKAEEEAADLRYQLTLARDMQIARGAREKPQKRGLGRGSRIDGGDLKRENLFDALGNRGGNWVQEVDLEFFKGATRGPMERGKGASPEQSAAVQRRLILGLGLSVVLGGLALVPLDSLSPKSTKPLFFFLTPLVRVQKQLQDATEIVEDARWDDLRFILKRIQGPPNNLKENLLSATSGLSDQRTRDTAKALATEIIEYVLGSDPDKYFDAMSRGSSRSGSQAAAFVEFSSSSLKVAQEKLTAFLKLFPAEDVQAARDQSAYSAF